jgi:hypothetical protein
MAYTNGKLDENKWKKMLRILQYTDFETMYQVFSKNSRVMDPGRDSRQQTESTPEAKRKKACIFFKEGKCRNGDSCAFVHSTTEGVIEATRDSFFCRLSCDILERIFEVQIKLTPNTRIKP